MAAAHVAGRDVLEALEVRAVIGEIEHVPGAVDVDANSDLSFDHQVVHRREMEDLDRVGEQRRGVFEPQVRQRDVALDQLEAAGELRALGLEVEASLFGQLGELGAAARASKDSSQPCHETVHVADDLVLVVAVVEAASAAIEIDTELPGL